MSGHNKWSTIKHKKGKADAKRGKVFTKVNKEISIAVKMGGPDPSANPRLRTAIAWGRSENMPKDNVDRAIKKASGDAGDVIYEELIYEGYGPSGVAVICEVMTDNRNRAVAEIRHTFKKFGGNLGENGCVAHMFDTKGQIMIEAGKVEEDKLMDMALEAGADDIESDENGFEVLTDSTSFEDVRVAIEESGIEVISAEISKIPSLTVELDGDSANKVLKMIDALEDSDDIQKVWTNADIDESAMEDA
jgi:YebC/PmpR family DNA-binding regulatory protein